MGTIHDFRDVDKLTPGDFEIFVRGLFADCGWDDLRITKVGEEYSHGDGGVDIFGRREGRRFAIEVKHRSDGDTIGVSSLNQLVTGAKLAGVKQMILVTNSYFSSEVRVRALRLGVELIDRDGLQTMCVQKGSEIGRRIKPRQYQQAVIDDILDKYASGKTKFLIEMATGLGKTYTAAELTKQLFSLWGDQQPRVLCIAHQVELLLQAMTSFKNVLGIGKYTYSACFDGADPEETDFVFASFDTLSSKLARLGMDDFDLVIVDEAHHTPADTFSQVVTSLRPRVLVGLTATPFRTDGRDVHAFFGGEEGHVGKYDLVWGLINRKLAFPKYTVLMDDLSPEKVEQLESGHKLAEIDRRLFLHRKDTEIVRIIEETITQKTIESPKAIVFCRNIAHMKHLLPFFPPNTATLVHAQMASVQRRANIREFREGKYRYILVCDLFNEGIDIPETNLLIFLRRTGSRAIWLQQLGRGLRRTKNKDCVHVLDFVGSLEKLAEIRQLVKVIEKGDPELKELSEGETHHDHRIEVHYNRAAAQIIPLIESMQLRLKSRQSAIETLRQYVARFGHPPSMEQIEQKLDDITYDQIATHFDSYFGYLTAGLGLNHDRATIRDHCLAMANEFHLRNGVWPSSRAVSEMQRVNGLVMCTQREVDELLGDYKNVRVIADSLSRTENADDDRTPPLPIVEPSHNAVQMALILRFVEAVGSIEELHELSTHTLEEIRHTFPSDFAFLKELRLERQKNDEVAPSIS